MRAFAVIALLLMMAGCAGQAEQEKKKIFVSENLELGQVPWKDKTVISIAIRNAREDISLRFNLAGSDLDEFLQCIDMSTPIDGTAMGLVANAFLEIRCQDDSKYRCRISNNFSFFHPYRDDQWVFPLDQDSSIINRLR